MSQKTTTAVGHVRRGVAAAVLTIAAGCQAFAPGFAEFGGERVRDLRNRAAQQDALLELRLELLPALMADAGIDCWLTLSDGISRDPLAARLTVTTTRIEGKAALLLCRRNGELARYALGRGFDANAALYEVTEPTAEAPLETLINERLTVLDPRRIAVNDARSFAAADGLSASDARWLRQVLAGDFADRLLSSRPLVEDFLAAQLDVETPLLGESARLTAAILEEVLSDRVVVAAGTSLADLDWAVRSRAAALDVPLVYPPHAAVYRPGSSLDNERGMGMDIILQPGDLVFLSAGISYLGYANRVGRWAYMLPSGARQAPAWVIEAMAAHADAAEAVAAVVAVGQSADEVQRAATAAVAGLTDPRVVVDRVSRLHEGALDPFRPAVVSGSWRPDFRLPAGAGLAITVQATRAPPTATPHPFAMVSLDTAVLEAGGARLVLPPQRTPLLID